MITQRTSSPGASLARGPYVGDRVDFWCLEVGPGCVQQRAVLGGDGFVYQQVELVPRVCGVVCVECAGEEVRLFEGELLLELHDLALAAGFDFVGDVQICVGVHTRGGGAGLGGVFEYAEGFEGVLVDEVEELVVVVFGFAGESRDQRGADRDAGHAVAEFVEEIGLVRSGDIAAHFFEDVVGGRAGGGYRCT